MSLNDEERALVEAQRLRDMARSIVRTDLETLRTSLAARPITTRVRDAAVTRAVDLAESATGFAAENRVVIALTLTGALGWLFRRRLGGLAQAGWTQIAGWLAQPRG